MDRLLRLARNDKVATIAFFAAALLLALWLFAGSGDAATPQPAPVPTLADRQTQVQTELDRAISQAEEAQNRVLYLRGALAGIELAIQDAATTPTATPKTKVAATPAGKGKARP